MFSPWGAVGKCQGFPPLRQGAQNKGSSIQRRGHERREGKGRASVGTPCSQGAGSQRADIKAARFCFCSVRCPAGRAWLLTEGWVTPLAQKGRA